MTMICWLAVSFEEEWLNLTAKQGVHWGCHLCAPHSLHMPKPYQAYGSCSSCMDEFCACAWLPPQTTALSLFLWCIHALWTAFGNTTCIHLELTQYWKFGLDMKHSAHSNGLPPHQTYSEFLGLSFTSKGEHVFIRSLTNQVLSSNETTLNYIICLRDKSTVFLWDQGTLGENQK